MKTLMGSVLALALSCLVATAQAQVANAPTETKETVATSTVETVAPSNALFCSCINYARSLGIKIPLVDADELTPNAPALVGNLVLLKYKSGLSHVAVITDLEPEGVYIKEANYHKCQKGERFIPFTDSNIIGFWTG